MLTRCFVQRRLAKGMGPNVPSYLANDHYNCKSYDSGKNVHTPSRTITSCTINSAWFVSTVTVVALDYC